MTRSEFPGWASNFAHSPLEWEGLRYADAESAFQSGKTADPMLRRQFAYPNPPGPGKAKQIGRGLLLRAGWEKIKDDVMLTVLRAKFHDVRLARFLIEHDEPLVEWTSWHDNWWGVCLCGRPECHGGRNRLGTLLMYLRRELRGQAGVAPTVPSIKGHQVPLRSLDIYGQPATPHSDMQAGRGDEEWVRYFAGEASS